MRRAFRVESCALHHRILCLRVTSDSVLLRALFFFVCSFFPGDDIVLCFFSRKKGIIPFCLIYFACFFSVRVFGVAPCPTNVSDVKILMQECCQFTIHAGSFRIHSEWKDFALYMFLCRLAE